MLYARLEQALARRGVKRAGAARVLVACSGGPDSIALAHVTAKLLGAARVVLGHVDHGVRSGSAEDADAVEAFGSGLGCSTRSFRLSGVGAAEASLRDARYAALERMRLEVGAELVLTAHTADDQAETVLLALLTRTHADALAGMPEARGAICRPWLTVGRAEVHAHVARHRLPARLDETNLEPRYLRNRVRKELLPLIEARYRPGFAARVAALAAEFERGPSPEPAPKIVAPSRPMLPAVKVSRQPWAPGAEVPRVPTRVVFDAAEVRSVVLRPIEAGDRIQPFGHFSARKVRDVLRAAGIIESERRLWHVVADDAGRVLWVPGLLRANHALIREKTNDVWLCEVDRKDELRGGAYRANLDGAAPGAYLAGREKSE